MITAEIRGALMAQAEEGYRDFQSALIPTQRKDRMLGVRTPAMRKLAREYARRPDVEDFLRDLPHLYYEENALHGFLIEQIRDYDRCMAETERFLPYVENWAVCDSFSPKVFARHKPEVFERCRVWLASDRVYTVRYGLVTLLKHFLTEPYGAQTLALAAAVDSGEYYINMAQAWLFAEAMAKCPETALPYFQQGALKPEVHNKAIQKAVESYRVPPETKAYLKTLKRKKH